MTELRHMRSEHCQHHRLTTIRWPYLTSCQRRFGGHLGSSRIRTYATWRVTLLACLHWVQWWSHNTSWIQGIFTHLHSLDDQYATTAMTFLMKITWLLAGISCTERSSSGQESTHLPRWEEVAWRESREGQADTVLCAGADAHGSRNVTQFHWFEISPGIG